MALTVTILPDTDDSDARLIRIATAHARLMALYCEFTDILWPDESDDDNPPILLAADQPELMADALTPRSPAGCGALVAMAG